MVADEGHADVGGKASRSQQPAFLSPFVAHTVMEPQSEGPKDPAYSSGACSLTTRIPLRGATDTLQLPDFDRSWVFFITAPSGEPIGCQ